MRFPWLLMALACAAPPPLVSSSPAPLVDPPAESAAPGQSADVKPSSPIDAAQREPVQQQQQQQQQQQHTAEEQNPLLEPKCDCSSPCRCSGVPQLMRCHDTCGCPACPPGIP